MLTYKERRQELYKKFWVDSLRIAYEVGHDYQGDSVLYCFDETLQYVNLPQEKIIEFAVRLFVLGDKITVELKRIGLEERGLD